MGDQNSLRALSKLDESTVWEQSGDVLAANDHPDEDEGNSGVAVLPEHNTGPGPNSDGLAGGEELESILSCVRDMSRKGRIEDVTVIVNTVEFDQLMFSTIERNDLIIGCLETAKLNWYKTQVEPPYYEEGEEE